MLGIKNAMKTIGGWDSLKNKHGHKAWFGQRLERTEGVCQIACGKFITGKKIVSLKVESVPTEVGVE